MAVHSRTGNIIIIGAFLAAILVPLGGMLLGSSSMALVEKRRLAALPQMAEAM